MIPQSSYAQRLIAAFLKYLIAGGTGFVVDFCTLSFCYTILGWHYLLSASLGFSAGLVVVYLLSNKWVFAVRQMKERRALEFAIFLIIGLIGLLLTNLLMWILVDGCGIHALLAKLVTTAMVLLWNFGARKIILY